MRYSLNQIIVIMTLLCSNMTLADQAGNAGDATVLSFVKSCKSAISKVIEKDIDGTLVTEKLLNDTFEASTLESTSEVLEVNGTEVDLKNIPAEQKIIISKSGWALATDDELKETLCIHELLGLLEIKDIKYANSTALLSGTLKPITSGNPVDILFVVDNSGSMAEEQAKLSAAAKPIIETIEKYTENYQIGVISTDIADGGIVSGIVDPFITSITSKKYTQLDKNLNLGTAGSGVEQGLDTLNQALGSTQNSSFFRKGARLEVIFITDEDDGSSINLIELIKVLDKHDPGFRAHGVLSAPFSSCTTGVTPNNQANLSKLIGYSGGQTYNLCGSEADYINDMTHLMNNIGVSL